MKTTNATADHYNRSSGGQQRFSHLPRKTGREQRQQVVHQAARPRATNPRPGSNCTEPFRTTQANRGRRQPTPTTAQHSTAYLHCSNRIAATELERMYQQTNEPTNERTNGGFVQQPQKTTANGERRRLSVAPSLTVTHRNDETRNSET